MARVDIDLQCLKIEVDEKSYLIGLGDLEQALRSKGLVQVVRITTETKQLLIPSFTMIQREYEKASHIQKSQRSEQ